MCDFRKVASKCSWKRTTQPCHCAVPRFRVPMHFPTYQTALAMSTTTYTAPGADSRAVPATSPASMYRQASCLCCPAQWSDHSPCWMPFGRHRRIPRYLSGFLARLMCSNSRQMPATSKACHQACPRAELRPSIGESNRSARAACTNGQAPHGAVSRAAIHRNAAATHAAEASSLVAT